MNEYTPSTEQVRKEYAISYPGADDDFDKRLASHDAELLATFTAPPATGDEREALARAIHKQQCGCVEWYSGDPEDTQYDETADAILTRFTVTPKNGDNRT